MRIHMMSQNQWNESEQKLASMTQQVQSLQDALHTQQSKSGEALLEQKQQFEKQIEQLQSTHKQQIEDMRHRIDTLTSELNTEKSVQKKVFFSFFALICFYLVPKAFVFFSFVCLIPRHFFFEFLIHLQHSTPLYSTYHLLRMFECVCTRLLDNADEWTNDIQKQTRW